MRKRAIPKKVNGIGRPARNGHVDAVKSLSPPTLMPVWFNSPAAASSLGHAGGTPAVRSTVPILEMGIPIDPDPI